MRKLGVSLAAAALVAILGLGWGIDLLFDRYAAPPLDEALEANRAFGAGLARSLDGIDAGDAFLQRWNQANASEPQVTLSLQRYPDFPLPAELRAEFERGVPLELESARGLTLNYLLPRRAEVLSIALPPLRAEPVSALSLGLTLLFYGGVLALLLLWLLPLLRRLSLLRETARGFGEGALERRIPLHPASYIADIEGEFNRMAQRIQTLVDDNKLLGNAVSHDLRTPLARLRFGIDALAETSEPALRQKYQRRISQDIAAMESLVELLLSYARLEASMLAQRREPLALDELVGECVDCNSEGARQIDWQPPADPCRVLAEPGSLRMAINNLLHNACRYARHAVQLRIVSSPDHHELIVDDDGPGIAPAQREHLFKPFVRGESAVGDGYGMGLAIVARVADWHQAGVTIEHSATLGGASMRLRLPRYWADLARPATPDR